MKKTLISIVADVVAGIAALTLFVLGDSFLHVGADLRVAVLLLGALFLCAGFVRGGSRPRSPLLKGILVSSLGSLVLLVLGWGSIRNVVLLTLLGVAILFTLCGVSARRHWNAHSVRKGVLLLVAPAAGLTVLTLAIIPLLTARIATRRTNTPVPAFSFKTLDGSAVDSSQFRKNVVLVDFWATWCPACRRELPELDRLYKRYQNNPSVSFWAVDVQKNGDTPEKARDFMRKSGFTLPVAVASESSLLALKLEGYPALIIIDKSGRIRLVHSGYDSSERLREKLATEIDALLNERL